MTIAGDRSFVDVKKIIGFQRSYKPVFNETSNICEGGRNSQ